MPKVQRGEVWQVDLGLAAKVRPSVIVSVPFLDHERAIFTIVPHTTALRGTRFEVKLAVTGLEPGAFDVQGLRPVPGTVLMRKRGVLTTAQLGELETALKLWLGLP
jgi:mRNA interferase MazF